MKSRYLWYANCGQLSEPVKIYTKRKDQTTKTLFKKLVKTNPHTKQIAHKTRWNFQLVGKFKKPLF